MYIHENTDIDNISVLSNIKLKTQNKIVEGPVDNASQ